MPAYARWNPCSARILNSVVYSARPMAGFEARIGLTDHVQLVPGVRMHGIQGGWLIRPSVGLSWKF